MDTHSLDSPVPQDIPPPNDEDLESAQRALDYEDGEDFEGGPAKKGKLTRSDIIRAIVRAMHGKPLIGPWPKFTEKFATMRDQRGNTMLFSIDRSDIVQEISEEALRGAIHRYATRCTNIDQFVTQTTIGEIMNAWRHETVPIRESDIKAVRQASKPGLTWHRLPWDLTDGPTPIFDEILSRMGNPEAFQTFIGSLFFDESDRQTYLWLYGDGNNSKGSIAEAIEIVFGRAFGSENPPMRGDRFWTSGLIGKRIVVFPDCNDFSFVTSGLFKSLTGGDRIRIEQKGKDPFSARLNVKFIFLSNEKPALNSQESDMRRAIFCEMARFAGEPMANYRQRLFDEAKHWLWKCIRKYQLACPSHGVIPFDRTANEDIAATTSEFQEMIYQKNFRFPEGRDGDSNFVTGVQMQAILKEERLNFMETRNFQKYLTLQKAVRHVKRRVNGPAVWVWEGLIRKTIAEKIDFDR